MTATTHSAMLKLAEKAAAYITRLNGESESFEVESNGMTAVVTYSVEIGEDVGDRWTAPSWWIERETVDIEAVYNTEGDEDAEAAAWLKKMLN